MRRAVLVAMLGLVFSGLDAGARERKPRRADAGVSLPRAADAGVRDAGVDAGIDAGPVDAGPPCSNAPIWQQSDGGALFEGTYTDLLQVPTGEIAWLSMEGLAAGFQCDDLQIASADAVADGGEVFYASIGVSPGQTDCVYRFGPRGERRRLFRVTVVPRCKRP